MTSSDRSTFLKKTFVAAAWMAVGAAVLFGLSTLFVEDGDRPPIIVSNGSVHVEVAQHGGDGNRGDLNSTNGKRWSHVHGKKAPAKLELSITGGLSTELGCGFSSSLFVQKLTTATINFTYGPDDKRQNGKLEFVLSKTGVEFTMTGTSRHRQTLPHAVDFGIDAAGVDEKATMTSVEWKLGNNNSTTCTFGGATPPQVVILQRQSQ